MGSDSLISYKTTMCYCVGVYLITMLKLMYTEPRPFWVNETIDVPRSYCPIGYAMPSLGTFNIVFFMSYTAFMQLYKYKRPEARKSWQIYSALLGIGAFEVLYITFMAFFGLTFFY